MQDKRPVLSTLWIFATLNYLYCDLVSLMDSHMLKQYLTGQVGAMQVTQQFLLGAGVLMAIPIGMVLLSRVLKYGLNRWANMIAGVLMTVVQAASLFVGTPTPYYAFFSVLEIAATISIFVTAMRWARPVEDAVA